MTAARNFRLYWFLIAIFAFLSASCTIQITITIPISENPDISLLIRYAATAYNAGHNLSIENIKERADSSSYKYDDKVLLYYNYFAGKITLNELSQLSKLDFESIKLLSDPYDSRILEYFKEVVKKNKNSSSESFLDYFDEKLSINLNPEGKENSALTKRVAELLKYDYKIRGTFYTWYHSKYSFEETINDQVLEQYSKILVEKIEGYDAEIQASSDDGFYTKKIDLKKAPTELVLAIMYEESKLFPAIFRAEWKDGKVYSISVGLSQILADVDSFPELSVKYSDFGNDKIENYTFETLRNLYFQNLKVEELFTLRGSALLSRTYLALIVQKIEKELR